MSRDAGRLGCVGLFVLTAAIAGRPALAAESDWSLHDYVQTTWTHRDGFPLASVIWLTQTPDGYLWFSDEDSAFRFDGVRFTTVSSPCPGGPALRAGAKTGLWLLCRDTSNDHTYRLFNRTKMGRYVDAGLLPRMEGHRPVQTFFDRQGRLWLYSNIVLRREADGTFRPLAKVEGDSFLSIVEDSKGTVWLSHESFVVQIRGDSAVYEPSTRQYLVGASSDGVVAVDKGGVWMLRDGARTRVAKAPPGVTFAVAPRSSAIDSTGAIWVATERHGIARVEDGRVETLLLQPTPTPHISMVFIDREDNVWLSSTAGLHRLRRPLARLMHTTAVPFEPLAVFVDSTDALWVTGEGGTVRARHASPHPSEVTREVFHAFGQARDSGGTVWLSNGADIGRFEREAFRPVRDITGAHVTRVRQFHEDMDGRLWAISSGVGIYQVVPGPPRLVFAVPDAGSNLVVSRRHGVWFASRSRGVARIPPGAEARPDYSVSEPEMRSVTTVVEIADSLWVGDSTGLWRWRNSTWTRWTKAHGLPGAGLVQEVVSDGMGRLWVMTAAGLLAVSQAALDDTPDGRPSLLKFVHIGALDGVVAHPGNPFPSPRAAKDRRGRLLFVTVDTVAIVDPSAVVDSASRSTIVLESVVADDETIDHTTVQRIVSPRKLQFDYTALTLRSPETVRFRYRLEGYDDTWVEAGSKRQVTYGALSPGSYRFLLASSSGVGSWSDNGVSYAFDIVPRFHNTWWFRASVVSLIAVVLLATYRLRLQRITQQMQLGFDARLSERTRIAQDLHDTLLQGTLAASLQAQLADQMLHDSAPDTAARRPLQSAIQLLSRVAAEGRATLAGLRTGVVGADLAEILYSVAREQVGTAAVAFRVAAEGHQRPLQPHRNDDIQHIAREAIVNAYRHAHARSVDVVLVFGEEHFHCFVRDNGAGMDQELLDRGRDGHWGLTGMRERAERAGGVLHVRSSRTAGTEVEFMLAANLAYADGTPQRRRWWRRMDRLSAGMRGRRGGASRSASRQN